MRYMTQEAYRSLQPDGVNASFRVSRRAESFSEEYYQQLRRRRERPIVRGMKERGARRFAESYPQFAGEFPCGIEDFESEAEYKRVRAKYEHVQRWLRRELIASDTELMRMRFDHMIQEERLREELPREILDRVADLRVLALGMAAPEVKRDIVRFRRERDRRVRAGLREYEAQYARLCARHPGSFLERFHFSGDVVEEIHKRGPKLVIRLRRGEGHEEEPGVNRITFRNCEILRRDRDLRDAEWLCEEVYEAEGGWEVHVLLSPATREFGELIFRCEDVQLE